MSFKGTSMGYWEDEFPQQMQREQTREAKWSLVAGIVFFLAGSGVAVFSLLHALAIGAGMVFVPYGIILTGLALIANGLGQLFAPKTVVPPAELLQAGDRRGQGTLVNDPVSLAAAQGPMTIRGLSTQEQMRRGRISLTVMLVS